MTLGVYTDEDEKNLKKLLDAFGSIVSLKDIASAYCQTGRDTSATAEILGQKGDSFAGSSTPKSQDCLGTEADAFSWSSDSHLGEVQSAKVKHKRCSTSMGTVAGVIGKEYVKPRPQSKGSSESYKPVKLSSDEIPVTAIWDGKNVSPGNSGPLIGESNSANESMKSDIEEFIYEMLGNGFQMDMTVIQDVVGQCGYNMQMSVDKLLDMSAATLVKSDDVIGMESGINMDNMVGLESTFRRQSPLIDFSGRSNTDIHSRDEFILPWAEKKKKVQREILESLFTVPNKIEEKQASSGPTIRVRRSPYGRSLAKPLKETIVEDFTFISRETVNNGSNKANDKSYEDWRNAVMEYWLMMKEYYKAAVDAFTQNEYEKAKKLVEEGNFYMKKVREADEESCLKIIEDSNEEEEFSINVYHLEPKDALRHLKLQLKSFSGFESIHNLKVVVGTNDGDAQAGKRKRLITKLLEKERIPWTEEGNGWTISIKVAEIDPNELSFVKK